MKISELNVGQGNVTVEGEITEIGEKRSFNKYGRNLMVCNAVFSDDSGTIKLTLWNDDAERFKVGDKIRISNGYVSEFQGEKQLTSGKFGTIEKISEDISENKSDSKSKESDNTKYPSEEFDDSTDEVLY